MSIAQALTAENLKAKFEQAVADGRADPSTRALFEGILASPQFEYALKQAQQTAPVEPGLGVKDNGRPAQPADVMAANPPEQAAKETPTTFTPADPRGIFYDICDDEAEAAKLTEDSRKARAEAHISGTLPDVGHVEAPVNGYGDPGADPADEWDRPETAPPAADAPVAGYDAIESVIAEAADIITGSRDVEYGTPERNLGRIAGMWSAYLGVTIDGRDVAWMMANVKQSRDRNRRKRDNLVDGLAYVGLAAAA